MMTANILLTFAGKLIVSSALLMLFYLFVFKQKAGYNNCRRYLLSVFILAMLSAIVEFKVWQPKERIVEIYTTENTVANSKMMPEDKKTIFDADRVQEAKAPLIEKEMIGQKFIMNYVNYASFQKWILLLYLIVAGILLLLLVPELFFLENIKRKGKRNADNGYKIVEHAKIETPFSFLRTIYLPLGMSLSKRELIIQHEKNHIDHKHYIDVLICEIVCRLLWFNPLFWWVRKELRDVDEFQVDNSILEQGYNVHQYQTILLEEVMEQRHSLANGFNTSFIIKRFRLMKEQNTVRLKKVRTLVTLPFILIVLALCTFTKGESNTRYIIKEGVNKEAKTINTERIPFDSDSTVKNKKTNFENLILNAPKRNELSESSVPSVKKGQKERLERKETTQERDSRILNNAYIVPDNMVQISPKRVTRNEIYDIERTEKYTKLVIAYPNYYNGHWYYTESLSWLVDLDTGEKYKIIKIEGDIPLDKTFVIAGYAKVPILLTYYYEPIPETTRMLRLLSALKPDAEIPSNNNGNVDYGVIYLDKYRKGKIIR